MKVHLISPKDNWILQKIGSKLMEITEVQMSNSQSIDYEADLNYFVNWCYWKILYPKLDKPQKTLIFFTHFDSHSEKYMDVLDRADNIAVMSLHGKEVLLNKGIEYEKIHVIEGFGTLEDLPYRKIKLGISGKPQKDGRKGEDTIEKLMNELNPDIFEFIFNDSRWENVLDSKNFHIYVLDIDSEFYNYIDYYLSPSHSEGGPMDLLNAAKCGIPIISTDIGFFHDFLKGTNDIVFKNYEDLLVQLLGLQDDKIMRINNMQRHTWDNFKDWHVKLFEEINGN